MPQPLLRFVRLVAAALVGSFAIALPRADTLADGGAPRRGERFQNNYVEF